MAAFDGAAFSRTVPWSVMLELTLQCNLACTHCYNFDRDRVVPGASLSRDEWIAALEQVRAAGCAHVGLTGGEAMAHPAFFDLVERSARLGLAAGILTNGTMLTDAAVDRLARYDHVDEVALSVYGATAATHDGVTRTPGSFERTMRGARRLAAARLPVMLKYIVMDVNADELESFTRTVELPWRADTYVRPRHTGDRDVERLRATPGQLDRVYRGPLRERMPDGCDDVDLVCGCARSTCAISASGDVYPCISVPMKCGNVRETPFQEIWDRSPQFAEIRALRRENFAACAPCPLVGFCGRSPGPAYILTGEYTGIDPWICADAEIRRRVAVE